MEMSNCGGPAAMAAEGTAPVDDDIIKIYRKKKSVQCIQEFNHKCCDNY